MKRFFCLASVLVLLTAVFLPRARAEHSSKDVSAASQALSAAEADAWRGEGERVTRFLVLGKDCACGLTDSIFVVTVNETARRATILQIPRDTYANYTQKDYKKLNGALNALGAADLKALLSRALGVRLDYFVILDLSCVRRIVDDLGGVDVTLTQDMLYSDPAQGLEIDLREGQVHLDGERAEQFIRYRSGYVNADLGRLDAQKLFLGAFAEKCKSISPGQLFQIMCHTLTRVQTDVGLPDAIRVLAALRECDTREIPMATLAGEAVQGSSGAWYYVINRASACEMVNTYLLPARSLSVLEFDPDALFDRKENREFHHIYTAEGDPTAN
ncbi:MAG: LCP family protein [Clostridia bacterium]|nr:LCP family protein [Clostridia bacterium]